MLTKEKIISGINSLPDVFTVDDVLDQIMFLSKIEEGLEQVERGEIISNDDLERKMEKWFD